MTEAPQGTPGRPRLAILVDGENAPSGAWPWIRGLLERLFPGRAVTATAFFCGTANGWSEHADVTLVDGGTVLRAKNAADFLLAFHAGTMAQANEADEFAIVSGDDGLAVVAQSLRERGHQVYAVIPCGGETYGSRLARAVDVPLLAPYGGTPEPFQPTAPEAPLLTVPPPTDPVARARLVAEAIIGCPGSKGGWAPLTAVGTRLARQGVSFGSKRLKVGIGSLGVFEFKGDPDHLLVRIKPGMSIADAKDPEPRPSPAPAAAEEPPPATRAAGAGDGDAAEEPAAAGTQPEGGSVGAIPEADAVVPAAAKGTKRVARRGATPKASKAERGKAAGPEAAGPTEKPPAKPRRVRKAAADGPGNAEA